MSRVQQCPVSTDQPGGRQVPALAHPWGSAVAQEASGSPGVNCGPQFPASGSGREELAGLDPP